MYTEEVTPVTNLRIQDALNSYRNKPTTIITNKIEITGNRRGFSNLSCDCQDTYEREILTVRAIDFNKKSVNINIITLYIVKTNWYYLDSDLKLPERFFIQL